MSHHSSLKFLLFDLMTHISHSDYNVIDFNYEIITLCGKRPLIRVQHVKTIEII